MDIILNDKNGVVLHTANKHCKEDISVKVDDSLILDTSDATATAGDILLGKTAYVNGEKLTGTNENKTSNDIKVEGNTLIINEANVEGSVLVL